MRRTRKTINQINVVPYIDVMLVLLVIFMVTAPLINPGEIELPSVGSRLTAPAQPLEVTLRTDGTLLLADRQAGAAPARVTRDEVVASIR
jgi:biopolymer transport protein TolR